MKSRKNTITQGKLNEAIYFHERMLEAYTSNKPEFEYFMNAFISSARSTTFVLQKEFNKKSGFSEWWKSNEMKKTKIFDEFDTLRTISIHLRPVKKSGSVWKSTFNFGEGVESKDGVVLVGLNFQETKPTAHVYAINEDGTKREVPNIASKISEDFTVIEYHEDKKKEVRIDSFLETADSYLESLKQIVNKCDAKFNR